MFSHHYPYLFPYPLPTRMISSLVMSYFHSVVLKFTSDLSLLLLIRINQFHDSGCICYPNTLKVTFFLYPIFCHLSLTPGKIGLIISWKCKYFLSISFIILIFAFIYMFYIQVCLLMGTCTASAVRSFRLLSYLIPLLCTKAFYFAFLILQLPIGL